MAQLIVIVDKLNQRKYPVTDFSDKSNIVMVAHKGFTFQSIGTVTNTLGIWYQGSDSYYYWGGGLSAAIPDTSVIYTNAEIARLAAAQNESSLKEKFPNILSVSDAVHDLGKPDSHVVALYLNDDNTAGIPDQLQATMPDGTIKKIATDTIKKVGKGSIQINQKDLITNIDNCEGSVCCLLSTPAGQTAALSAGHVYSDGNSNSAGGYIANGGSAFINGDTATGSWLFQLINSKTDAALAAFGAYPPDDAYISFKEKTHYIVSDADVKHTMVRLVSNKSGDRTGYILDYNTAWDVAYADDTYQKNGIILIGSTNDKETAATVSKKGDSGGCVFEPITGNLVGLILGGNDKFTWVLPLQKLFNDQQFKLL